MQKAQLKVSLFLAVLFGLFFINQYYLTSAQKRSFFASEVKLLMTDVASNSYLIAEQFALIQEDALSNREFIQESINGRFSLLNLNIELFLNRIDSENENSYKLLGDTLQNQLNSLENALSAVNANKDNENYLTKQVAQNAAKREANSIYNLANSLAEKESEQVAFDRTLINLLSIAGVIISVVIPLGLIVLFLIPAFNKNIALSEKIVKQELASRTKIKELAKGTEEQKQLKQDYNQAKRLLEVANFSLVKKNESEARAKNDLEHFVLQVNNYLHQPLEGIISGIKRLNSQIETAPQAVVKESSEYSLIQAQGLADRLATIKDLGISLNKVGNYKDVYLSQLIAEVLASQNANSNVKITVEKNLPEVKAFEKSAFFIVNELIQNAIKFNTSPHPEIHISYALKKEYHEIQVVDNGTPLAENEVSHIFDAFYRLKKHGDIAGEGLGLSIIKYLAQRVDGNVTFKLDKRGNAFTYRWPAKL